MYRSTSRWTTAVAAAALMALPVAAAAQSTPQQTTPPQQQTQPQQTPPQTQPPPMQPAPTQQPTQQPTASPSQPAAAGQVDAAAAKQHLSEARDTLSQITSMPEAAKLQGESRTQVSQLISNFNELITTQSNWRAAYGKVDANLTSLIGADSADQNAASGTAGAVGTSGSAAATSIDPAIRAKLVEFRAHLKQFEESAGGPHAGDSANAMAPSAATGSTANPSNPAASSNPTDPSQPPSAAGATGTSGAAGSPTASMGAADQAKASEQVGHAEADKHLDAISTILNKSKTGTLTRAQTAELKKHVAELRRLLQQQQ